MKLNREDWREDWVYCLIHPDLNNVCKKYKRYIESSDAIDLLITSIENTYEGWKKLSKSKNDDHRTIAKLMVQHFLDKAGQELKDLTRECLDPENLTPTWMFTNEYKKYLKIGKWDKSFPPKTSIKLVDELPTTKKEETDKEFDPKSLSVDQFIKDYPAPPRGNNAHKPTLTKEDTSRIGGEPTMSIKQIIEWAFKKDKKELEDSLNGLYNKPKMLKTDCNLEKGKKEFAQDISLLRSCLLQMLSVSKKIKHNDCADVIGKLNKLADKYSKHICKESK